MSELTINVVTCSSRSASCNVIREADAMMEPVEACAAYSWPRAAGPRRQELYPPTFDNGLRHFCLLHSKARGSTTLHVNI